MKYLRDCTILFVLLFGFFSESVGQNPYTDSLIQVLKTETDDSMKVENLYNVGADLFYSFPDSAIGYARTILTLANNIGFPVGEGYSHYLRASAFEVKEDYDSAAYYYKKTVRIMQDQQDTSKLAVVLGALGGVFYSQRQTDSAIYYYFKTKDIQESIGDLNSLSYTLNSIGNVYHNSFEDYEKALTYFQQAYEIRKKEGTEKEVSSSEQYLADILNDLGRKDTAIILYHKVLAYNKKMDKRFDVAGIHNNLGRFYFEIDQFEQSLAYYDSALQFFTALQSHIYISKIYMNMAQSFQYLERFEEALAACDSNLYHARQAKAIEMIRSAYRTQYEVLEAKMDYKEALEAHKQYFIYEDSLLKQDNNQLLEELEAKYKNQELQQNNEIQKLEIEQERQLRIQILLGSLLLILMVGGGLGLFSVRQRSQRINTQMELQLKETEAQSLRELNTIKSRFFSNISHEFRTPLTLILGPLRELAEGNVTGNPSTYFQMMRRNGERLLQLINQLLDLSKLESGKLSLQLKSGDILGFIRGIAGSFESLAESKQIRFHILQTQGHLNALFDHDKLEKILNNLLANAFKFTPEGGDVTFTCRIEEANSDKFLKASHSLEIMIQDNGIGMTEEQLTHIFERFYRVENDAYEGSGIGLALMKELVDLHQGEISVSSEPGQGSLFVIRLPILAIGQMEELKTETRTQPIIQSVASPQAPAVPKQTSSDIPLILLVEDNQDVRSFIRSLLQTDYRIIEAQNGKQGLELAESKMPDLVISDVMMPEMDGYAFTQHLKQQQISSHIPVILLTAKAGQHSKLEGLETGADAYLQKPFDQAELKIRIRNLIEQRKQLRKRFGKEIISIEPKDLSITSVDKAFLSKAIEVVERYMGDESFRIEDLASELALSRSQLHRKLKALTDQSPSVFLRTLRLKRAHHLLSQQTGTAAEISFQVGFSSPAYFSKCFKDQFGISPSEIGK